jgi:dolichol-phosphate mannosyltransferase
MVFILLPVYNEEKNLPGLLEKIRQQMQKGEDSYQLIAYNDGSNDLSLELLTGYKNSLPITIISGEKNMGLGVALDSLLKQSIALSSADKDIAVVLDSDDTHNPELVPLMTDKLKEGFDVVIASRYLPKSRVFGVSWFRQLLSIGASWLMRILFPIKGVRDYTSGYRAYSIGCLRMGYGKFGGNLIEEESFACMAELLIKLRSINIKAIEIPIVLRYDRKLGKSKMKILKTILKTITMLYRVGNITKV